MSSIASRGDRGIGVGGLDAANHGALASCSDDRKTYLRKEGAGAGECLALEGRKERISALALRGDKVKGCMPLPPSLEPGVGI